MTATRVRALDAAIDLVGTQGLRALTHARVDGHAGLPKGSTSNYFRTRQALLVGVVERLAELDLAEVGAAFSPASVEDFVEALCGLFEHMTVARRTHTAARLALFAEASHNAPIREALSQGRAAMESTAVVAMARLGARRPHAAAAAIAACFEGLLLHRVARHDDVDPRPTFDLVVRAALG